MITERLPGSARTRNGSVLNTTWLHSIGIKYSVLLISIALVLPSSLGSQSSNTSTRDAIVKEIKDYAARHVKANAPMQTEAVITAFSSRSIGLTPEEIGRIYEEEYLRLKDSEAHNFWKQVLPSLPWLLVVCLFLTLIFRDALKEWITGLLKTVLDQLYESVAGKRIFHRIALRHYRRALNEKYRWLRIPFRPNRPLDMRTVYVPLKLSGAKDEMVDVKRAIRDHRRVMIVAAPGSGKSMLLKQLALSYAEDNLPELAEQPTPILLELHRMNDPKLSFAEHLVAELARNDFPGAERFLTSSLESGTLMLLLDGLDEVSSGERQRVVGMITDLLDRHRTCRAVFTCRSAVYRNEFADYTDQKCEIVEFTDQQIRQFLSSWERDMPPGRSVEILMRTLQDRPRIMALARNPLLLTIIAYLYTDTEYILPHSRAEFYRQSTDFLLAQLHPERNQFEARAKRLVLQHLALFNQDSGSQLHQDRRSMDYKTVLAELRKVLPDLNLDPNEKSIPLLTEIVERSGLLLSIDGGENYQFAHLTLQEYFAAAKLIGDPQGLVQRFSSQSDAWREVIKLWCGLDVDSTSLIRQINSTDPITALECLADSQKVDPAVAETILSETTARLSDDTGESTVARAFAAIASDTRPRGARVFRFLEGILVSGNSSQRVAAANALSLTNLPQAARVLARYERNAPGHFRTQIVRMGDLAVPELTELIDDEGSNNSSQLVDDLRLIGTPAAALALVRLLWHSSVTLAGRSAWCLASLLSLPGVEDTLRRYQAYGSQKKEGLYSWIWAPFGEAEDSALPRIAERMALLMADGPKESVPAEPTPLDRRLAIPFCAIIKSNEIRALLRKLHDIAAKATRDVELSVYEQIVHRRIRYGRPNGLHRRSETILESEGANTLLTAISESKLLEPRVYLALCSLTPQTLLHLTSAFLNGWKISQNHWRNIRRPLNYTFAEGWHFKILLAISAIPTIAGIMEIFRQFSHQGHLLSLKGVFLLVVVTSIVAGWLFFIFGLGYLDPMNPSEFVDFLLLGLFRVPRQFRRLWRTDAVWAISLLPFLLWLPSIASFAAVYAARIIRWSGVVIGAGTLAFACVSLWVSGHRMERKALNPLLGILDYSDSTILSENVPSSSPLVIQRPPTKA